MPVYNEEDCIADVIRSWLRVFEEQQIHGCIIVLNDGSRDGTEAALRAFANDKRIDAISKLNSGHGPTILMGYHKAVDLAEWVFQCDSDDEMKAEYFPRLWGGRDQYDALFGIRAARRQNAARRLISFGSRLTVRLLFGKGVVDVNSPYRLLRSQFLKPIIGQIPDDTFAPNVMISGAVSRAGLRIYNTPIPHEGRRTGTVSIVKWKLWKMAFRSFWQTLRCRPVLPEARKGVAPSANPPNRS
jgi:dolichol-phosphate mannosyltransferase